MKIFIAVESNIGLDAPLADHFGRAEYFLIYDRAGETMVTILENTFKDEAQGVGIRVATLAAQNGCGAVIGAQPGPKAVDALTKAGIRILAAKKRTARQALDDFKSQL